MSHVADVEMVVTDLDALDAVCQQLGLELVRGKKTYTWYGRWVNDYNDPARAAAARGFDPEQFGKCEHAIKMKGGDVGHYEIGLVPRRDGGKGWELLYDNYSSGRNFSQKLGGAALPVLKDELGAELSKRHLIRQGYKVSRSVENGAIVMRGLKA